MVAQTVRHGTPESNLGSKKTIAGFDSIVGIHFAASASFSRKQRFWQGLTSFSRPSTRRLQVSATILRIVLIVFGFLLVTSLWGFYASIRPPKIISSLTPRDLNMGYEDVSFKTANGLTLRGWHIPSARSTAKTLVLLHGYPADKGDILPGLAFLHEIGRASCRERVYVLV